MFILQWSAYIFRVDDASNLICSYGTKVRLSHKLAQKCEDKAGFSLLVPLN